jgi:hypothetical protein
MNPFGLHDAIRVVRLHGNSIWTIFFMDFYTFIYGNKSKTESPGIGLQQVKACSLIYLVYRKQACHNCYSILVYGRLHQRWVPNVLFYFKEIN